MVFPFSFLRHDEGPTLTRNDASVSNIVTANSSSPLSHDHDGFVTAKKDAETSNVVMLDNSSSNVYFVRGKRDRSGSFIQDLLHAHAWLWSRGWQFGGTCSIRRAKTKKLLLHLGLEKVLPVVDCNEEQHARIIEKTSYMAHDTKFMTLKWKNSFLKEWDKTSHSVYQKIAVESRTSYNIVVHIRRGDVSLCRYPKRYLPNFHYQRLIDQHTPNNATKNVVVTIFSESKSIESFHGFEARGYNVMLDSPLNDVW
eukprot:CAMPEP_0172440336 /NCGR_PEP_ID=MMETSP1065-20121228/986_1 /TAXON_ID=265537 /ORGANISM="Amphiprora paludosa, Strain CCMP125" /LENGTH=253 /DNA_ID=CAMNT_0013189125 /DNA_START=230 /DNA_END=988 /DNA_ORIENTATION=+